MAGDEPQLTPRARLYARLPDTPDIEWWVEVAARSSDGTVLELGAGTGRITRHLQPVANVTAVDRDATALGLVPTGIEVLVADVADLDLASRQFGVVLLPVALLNELPDREARQSVLASAARHCRPGGVVALQILNPFWLLLGGDSDGTITGTDGREVDVTAHHRPADVWSQRARAGLRYAFDDGEVIVDQLDASAIFPEELVLLLGAAGLEVVEQWGATPGEGPPTLDDGSWYVVARRRVVGDLAQRTT